MENKKLLKYLLKDLTELDELFTDRESFNFDDVEAEFIQARVRGAKKLIQMFLEQPVESNADQKVSEPVKEVVVEVVQPVKEMPVETVSREIETVKEKEEEPVTEIPAPAIIVEAVEQVIQPEEIQIKQPVVEKVKEEKKTEISQVEKKPETNPIADVSKKVQGVFVNELVEFIEETIAEIDIEEKLKENEPVEEIEDIKPEIDVDEKPEEKETTKPVEKQKTVAIQQELKLDDESPADQGNKRLADTFSKEKSLNELVADDSGKLEHKLSNLPISSIQASIGINDRFQYVRELFNGNTELYNKTVSQLDSMNDLKEAVAYLQGNFKWKKNEISLKFVSLLKRRFPQ